MKIEMWPIGKLKPYSKNPRDNKNAILPIAESIKRFGFRQPIVVDKKAIIIVGHTRFEAAKHLGMKQVPVHVADMDPKEARAYRIADNKLNEKAEWDMGKLGFELEALLKDIPMDVMGFDPAEVNKILKGMTDIHVGGVDYSKKITAPIYEPGAMKPSISQLVDFSKADELIADIEKSKLRKDEKDFLIAAAKRHVVFNYRNIADYYANSDKEMQDLMERSALVIIDFKKAIECGFVKLSGEIAEQYTGTIKNAK